MSVISAAPVKKAKHKAHKAVIDASGGSLTKKCFQRVAVGICFAPLVAALAATAGGELPRAATSSW
jgi:hypothetical protein